MIVVMEGSATPTPPVVPNTPNGQPAPLPAPQPKRVDGFKAPSSPAANPPTQPLATPPPIEPMSSPYASPPNPPSATPPYSPQPSQLPPQQEQTQAPAKHRSFANFKTLLSIAIFIVGIVVAATLINQFIFQSYYVDGTSMTPTLQNNDRLIIDKVERTSALLKGKSYVPKRGQVVVLDSSLVDQYGHNEQLIKRVIGLPGETVIVGSDGLVIVKNAEHPAGFNVNDSLGLKLESTYVDAPMEIKIPNNQVFVMGDNRGPGGSFDSRAFGPVGTNKIQGRLLARIFPLNKTEFF
jgi:signal peptidase I